MTTKDLKTHALIVAVSSRALFDLEQSNRVFDEEGSEAFMRHQIDREKEVLKPGVAFSLVSKLLALNRSVPTEPGMDMPRVEVILVSRNNADAGLRVFNAIASHGLDISRAVFTTGRAPFGYARAFGAHLFLSANESDVRGALRAGIAAATILTTSTVRGEGQGPGEIRIAFDGDAVLFDDQAERVYKAEGLSAFRAHESERAGEPLPEGPFAGFLNALHRIQRAFPANRPPLRTALITARGAPSHERVIRTLRQWGIRLDEMVFLDGLDKQPFLEAFGADFFFDDQKGHVESAGQVVGAAHVPHGVANE